MIPTLMKDLLLTAKQYWVLDCSWRSGNVVFHHGGAISLIQIYQEGFCNQHARNC